MKKIDRNLPSIVFKYECGMANYVGLHELYKSPELKDDDFPRFARCGWSDCNCHIVDMFLDDGNEEWDARWLDTRLQTKPVPFAAQMLGEAY